MLDAMRKGALNWGAKVLLGLLAFAFVIWGMGPWLRGYGSGTIAKIGNTDISAEDYRQAYQDEMTSISRRFGRRLTPEQAKLLGIEQRALSRLVGFAALDSHARQLNLALSDKTLADLIRTDPAFQGPTGTFSTQAFQNVLRQVGLSEARFVADRRKEEIRDQLTETLLAGDALPQHAIEVLHGYRAQTRVIDYLTPNFDLLIKVAEPDDAALKDTYEQNKGRFVTPEQRKINVLLLTLEAVKARTPVSDEDVKAAYESDKEKFNEPEKRRIFQLAFPDKAAAEKAYADLSKAKNFQEAAAKLGFKESDTDLGMLKRRDMIDAKIAEAAFGLKKDELSKPIEGQFSIVLVRVEEIVPGKQRTFDEVKAEIKDRLASERAAQEVQTLRDKVEDDRATGKPLREIANALQLPFSEIASIDRAGKTPEGQPAVAGADGAKIADAAFSGGVGIEAEAAELPDGGYAWVDVLGVTAEQQKAFDAVKDEVKTLALDLEKRKQIATYSASLVERLNKGEAFDAIAKEIGSKVEHTAPITRATTPQGLTQNSVQQAFALPKGGAASALTADGKARTILRVSDISAAPPPTKEQSDRIAAELTRQLQDDFLAEYLTGLQARFGFSVNEAALRQVLGSGGERAPLEND
jgi:peptidyl-prolyl cis-trans isomerase D